MFIKWRNSFLLLRAAPSAKLLGTEMVAILIWEARDVGLETSQWFWLIVIAIIVAGLCIWIISWGDDKDEEEEQLAQLIDEDRLASESAAAEEE